MFKWFPKNCPVTIQWRLRYVITPSQNGRYPHELVKKTIPRQRETKKGDFREICGLDIRGLQCAR